MKKTRRRKKKKVNNKKNFVHSSHQGQNVCCNILADFANVQFLRTCNHVVLHSGATCHDNRNECAQIISGILFFFHIHTHFCFNKMSRFIENAYRHLCLIFLDCAYRRHIITITKISFFFLFFFQEYKLSSQHLKEKRQKKFLHFKTIG